MAGEPAPVNPCGIPNCLPCHEDAIRARIFDRENRIAVALERIAAALEKMVDDESDTLTASIPSVWNFPNGSDDH